MSADNLKPAAGKAAGTKATTPGQNQAKGAKPPESQTPQPKMPLPPLFRGIDWLAFGATALLVFLGYLYTLAPDLTLEDSGELATGSFYAGVPHPPGYPLWTIFTWAFTKLVPISNIAYRVSIASAFAGAMATGLLALITSRGSSMLIESIPDFKGIARKVENWMCLVAGFVAGTLLAFNGYMWSQSVIVEVYPFSVLSLMVVICLLLRWVYAPHQKRYLYFAWLVFGICFTNHQTLIVAAMGLEIAIIAAKPKLGRDFLLLNSLVYMTGYFVLDKKLLGTFEPSTMVIMIFHIVGVASIIGCVGLSFWRCMFPTFTNEKFNTELVLPGATGALIALADGCLFYWGKPGLGVLFILGCLALWTVFTFKYDTEIWSATAMLGLWVVGALFYFYMPLTSMTNPPMNWGYSRTVEGFIHALTRGQYEKINASNFIQDPIRFLHQLWGYFVGAKEEFNLVNLALALVPLAFFLRVQKRERAWMIGLGGIWACLAVLLLILLNPAPDRASRDLNKVFFTASYTVIAMFIGYGLTLVGAFMVTQYEKFRFWGIAGGGVAAALALYTLAETTQTIFGDKPNMGGFQLFFYAISRAFHRDQYALPLYAGMILLALGLVFAALNLWSRTRPRIYAALVLFALLPVHSILSHWSDNEERGHLFGFWFGHDMFTPPFGIYPKMTKDAVLFGGTDPGRFCPTYMIFCESFIPPEKRRDPDFDRRDVYIITQNALADGTYLCYIRAHYFRSAQQDPPFFQELIRRPKLEDDPTNFLARAAFKYLDKPFLDFGEQTEKRRRKEGVYPPKEIYTPSVADSQRCFDEYLQDAARRLDHDKRSPNEPHLIKPGEEVREVVDEHGQGRVQVTGQVAVMAINGLLTKVIFDHNPTNEFFVEESFPLDWMYPHLTPSGIIMKINRQPLSPAEFNEDILQKDHEFWSRYSERLIGNWITYDTSIKEIADFVEKVYLERDFSGFKGDRKFIRDDQGQKAFSKLRSSIGGILAWRVREASQTGLPPDQQSEHQKQLLKETDFALQAGLRVVSLQPGGGLPVCGAARQPGGQAG